MSKLHSSVRTYFACEMFCFLLNQAKTIHAGNRVEDAAVLDELHFFVFLNKNKLQLIVTNCHSSSIDGEGC